MRLTATGAPVSLVERGESAGDRRGGVARLCLVACGGLVSGLLNAGVPILAQYPDVAVVRAGVYCVFVGSTGIAVVEHRVYDRLSHRLVACPQIGDPGPILSPGQ